MSRYYYVTYKTNDDETKTSKIIFTDEIIGLMRHKDFKYFIRIEEFNGEDKVSSHELMQYMIDSARVFDRIISLCRAIGVGDNIIKNEIVKLAEQLQIKDKYTTRLIQCVFGLGAVNIITSIVLFFFK